MTRFLIGLIALACSGGAQAAPAHYDLKGRLSPDGWFKAEVEIVLPPEDVGGETAFLLSRRFTLEAAQVDGGGRLRTETTDKPLARLNRIVVSFPAAPAKPVTLRLRYQGPLVPREEAAGGLELRLEHMWIPARSDLNLRFTSRAVIDGIDPDRVVVAQGEIRRDGEQVTLARDVPDMDMPFVAVKGLKRLAADHAEIYALDPESRLIRIFAKHAPAAVTYHERHLGPIPGGGPVRMVVHPRLGSGYARRGFISSTDPKPEPGAPEFPEANPAAFIAHEFAHAWWSAADPLSEHYWLVESLAEYSSLRYLEFAFGKAELEQRLARKRDRAKTAGPILGGARPTRDALYAKGCLLLFELDARIGREAMDKVLARLGRAPPRTTAEFMRVLADVAGDQAARDFEAALRA